MIKSWIKYFFYIIALIFIIMLREYVGNLFTLYFKQFFQISYLYMVINLLLSIGIGVLLGLGYFIREKRKEGKWKINLPKLIVLGLPSLYFGLTNILMYSGGEFFRNIIAYPAYYFLRYGGDYIAFFQIILGYVIITSFFKNGE